MISKNVGNIISSVKVPDMMLTVILAEPMLTVILMIMILKTIASTNTDSQVLNSAMYVEGFVGHEFHMSITH